MCVDNYIMAARLFMFFQFASYLERKEKLRCLHRKELNTETTVMVAEKEEKEEEEEEKKEEEEKEKEEEGVPAKRPRLERSHGPSGGGKLTSETDTQAGVEAGKRMDWGSFSPLVCIHTG